MASSPVTVGIASPASGEEQVHPKGTPQGQREHLPLSALADLKSGGTPSKGDPRYWGGAIPWLTPKDMGDFTGETQNCVTPLAIGNGTRMAPANCVFVAVRGMSLHNEIRVVFASRQMSFNQDIKAVVATDIDPRFLYYVLTAAKPSMLSMVESAGHGTGVLPTDKLASLPILQVSPGEQTAVARILGTLDDLIELNRRTNQTLEAVGRAIFQDWFVDYGPVHAKAEHRSAYLPAEVWDLFPRSFDGGVPQGWIRGPVSDWVNFNPAETLPKGVVAPYLDMGALPTEGSTTEEPLLREFGSGMKFRNGDTLMARITPCLENGKTAFVQSLPDDAVAWGSTEFIVMRPIAPVPRPYAYLLARDAAFREHAIRSMTGTSGRQRAQVQAIASFPVCLPTAKPVWDAFAAIVDPLFAGIRANADESRALGGLRDALLPKLISGDIRIKDAERFIEEATT